MSFIGWPDGAMAVFQWSCGLGTWTNRMAFTKPNFTLADMQSLSGNMEAALRTSYKQLLADTVTFYGIDVIDMRAFGAQAYISPFAGAPGLDTNEVLPPSVCVVITQRTPGRGRAFRGRIYLSGFAEDQLDAGVWDGAATTECLDQIGAWRQVALAVGWTHSLPTTYINKVKQDPAVMTPITSVEVRSGIPGHQRRRDRRP